MPNTREKLIELLETVPPPDSVIMGLRGGKRLLSTSRIADHLIANGVTIQKEGKLYWKQVEPGEWNLTCSACDSHLGCREGSKYCPECGAKFVYPKAVAPEPPKED